MLPHTRSYFRLLLTLCVTVLTVQQAHAGFVMGSSASGSNNTPPSAPVIEDSGPIPEYEAIETETLHTPTPTGLQAGTTSAPPVDEESTKERAQRRAWKPIEIEPPTHVESYGTQDHSAAMKPARVPLPERSIDMPKEDPVLKLKRMGNLPVVKPETRVQMMDSDPDNMPYNSANDVMKKPIDAPPAKAWNDGSVQEIETQMQTRRISQEIQNESRQIFIDPFPDKRVPKAETPVAAETPVIKKQQSWKSQQQVPPASVPDPRVAQNYSDAVGFASDIPLALALSQVVPPEYAYSFANGVNPGYRVSWNGGKPWNEVVAEMVAPLNLTSDIQGTTIVIRQGQGRTGAAETPEAAPQKMAEAVAPPAEILKAPPALAQAQPLQAEDVAAIAPAAGEIQIEAPKAELPKAVIPTPKKITEPLVVSAADVSMPPEDVYEETTQTLKAPATPQKIAAASQAATAQIPKTPEPFTQPLERVETKAIPPKMAPIEKVVEVGPVKTVPHITGRDLSEADILKPVPQKIASAANTNQDLGLPASQPRRSQVKDPGEQVGEQPAEAVKAIKDIREFKKPVSSSEIEAQQMEKDARAAMAVDSAQSQKQSRIWEAKQGDSLKKILNDWSTQANVAVDWEAAHDYALSSNIFINGTYSNAIKILFTHGFDKGVGPAHKLYDTNGGNTLVVKDPA